MPLDEHVDYQSGPFPQPVFSKVGRCPVFRRTEPCNTSLGLWIYHLERCPASYNLAVTITAPACICANRRKTGSYLRKNDYWCPPMVTSAIMGRRGGPSICCSWQRTPGVLLLNQSARDLAGFGSLGVPDDLLFEYPQAVRQTADLR